MANNNDIAIVGMSCYFPGANSIQEFWNNLANGVSSISDAPAERIDPRFFTQGKPTDVDRFYFHKGGFVSPISVDPLEYGILPIAAEGIDPEQLASLYLVKEALKDAGVYEKNISLQKCCFIIGKGNYGGISGGRIGGYTYISPMLENLVRYVFPEVTAGEIEVVRKEYQEELGRYKADTASGSMSNLTVSLAANRFDMKGPAFTLDAACASSLLAVEQAINLLMSEQCDIALAGGMHLGQGASFWSIFNLIGAASRKNRIAPFSEDADGLLIGEGVGIVVLKKLNKAIADNDRIYAVIKGYASGSDGSDVSVMAPSFKGQLATLKLAWEKSGMDPKKIGYVEAHGTATQVGDRVEIATLTEFFGDNTAPPALLGAVKSNIGHAMPAAGIAGLIKTVLALYHKKIPPTLHCEKPMKAVLNSRFLPVQELTDWDGKKYPLVAAVNAFGFGGVNTHIILEAYENKEKTVNQESTEIAGESGKKQIKMDVKLDFSNKIIDDFPFLKQVVTQLIQKKTSASPVALDFSEEELNDAILQAANNNLHEIANLQNSLLQWYRSNPHRQHITKIQSEKSPAPVSEGVNLQRAGTTLEKTIRFDLDKHPYLLDHKVVRQRINHPLEELNPLVPFTMTIETLCDLTMELVPGKKILRVSAAGVQKWIPVREPFIAKITGQWKTGDCISWMLPAHAYGDVIVGDTYPVPSKEYEKEIDLGEDILPEIPKKEEIYLNYLFHGPQYQSIVEVTKITKKGLSAHIRKKEGKGSMLDAFGQLLGLYCRLMLEENQATFPMSVNEIIFYQDFDDQGGDFDFTLTVEEIKSQEITSNVIVKRNGKVWCVVNGWRNLRLNYSLDIINVGIRPTHFLLAKSLNNNIFYYYKDNQMKVSGYEFLFDGYLNSQERKHYNSLYPNQAIDYLISRIALKDGVRKYIRKEEDTEFLFPIEPSVRYDEHGKPCLYGHEKLEGIEVSIAHKGSEAVVIVSDKPAGIDIEKIEARNKEFMDVAFTPHELDLLKEKGNEAEWIARFWVAKESYGKMLGLGLQGNPKQYEVESINGEELKINNTTITTTRHRDNYIIGWTN